MFIKASDGVDLFVKVSGSGEPCVFIHGGPGNWSANFEELGGNALEDFMEMVYFDQRGCGRSGKVENGDFSLKRVIDDIDEIRKSLNIEKWHVLAHSFGGILAVNYADAYPESISSVILLNCTLNMEYSFECQIRGGIKLLGLKDYDEYIDTNVDCTERYNKITKMLNERGIYYKMICSAKEFIDKIAEVDSKYHNDFKFQRYIKSHEEYTKDHTPITEKINVPVLVISGENDYAIGPDHHRDFKFSNQEIYIAKKGSHFFYYESNREFYECIKQFIHS